MKRIILAIISVLFTFIGVTFAVSAIILNSDKILKGFSIINVDNISNVFTVNFEKVKAAKYYDVVVYKDNSDTIFNKRYEKTNIKLTINGLEYDSKYKLVIYAYDKLGDSIGVINPYTFTYTEPTFSIENDLVLVDEKDYELLIDGNLKKKDYIIKISDNDHKIKEEKLITNKYKIDNKYFTGVEKKLDIEIIDGSTIIDKISLFNNMSPITDIKIDTPNQSDVLDYKDVSFGFTGGENATKYILQIYKKNDIIKEVEVKKNRSVISSEIFEKAQAYKIVINAKYRDHEEFSKMAEVMFTMNELDTLKPVYLDVNPKYLEVGSDIVLNNPNEDGTIYYTTNGLDPSTNGIKYTKPIPLNGNMTIKTVVMEPNKNNSIINEFNLNIGKKENLSIYLSPSNQTANIGVREVGYTNEMKEMNDLTNHIEKRLKESGVKVYRNSPYGDINLWTSDSRYYGVDLHLAIHSNASITHTVSGIETWIDEESSSTYSLAQVMQKALLGIYYNNDPITDRGVKYANGSLGEVNRLYVPFGILLEVAHHDHEKDAAWIMQNKELIANTIADSLLKYYGIK